MQASLFLLINGLIVFILVFRLFSFKKPRPTPLSIQPNKPTTDRYNATFEDRQNDVRQGPQSQTGRAENKTESPFSESVKTRSLNCVFQYNGHTWDAFEVLGVPAGSDRESCRRALIDLKRNGHQTQEFIAALSAALDLQFS